MAITGASGSIYGWDLLQRLETATDVARIFLVVSRPGRDVFRMETGQSLAGPEDAVRLGLSKAVWFDESDWFAPIASGSCATDGMVIAPCTMSTLGEIAAGTGRNLIHRAADVCLKERRPLVLVPRETPLNIIHLENMLRAARAGAIILPAMPAFYSRPQSIDELAGTVSARVLAVLGSPLPDNLTWTGQP
ncbi:MAG TPA: UbiX family flavin prenyltransferase [Acidobacteriota bacterium]|nr:UbiX family flavin prenyltransferase [Acidobacteriota bacterium]